MHHTNLCAIPKKHADILLGALSHGHAHVLRYLKQDYPSPHKVTQRDTVSKSALVRQIQLMWAGFPTVKND